MVDRNIKKRSEQVLQHNFRKANQKDTLRRKDFRKAINYIGIFYAESVILLYTFGRVMKVCRNYQKVRHKRFFAHQWFTINRSPVSSNLISNDYCLYYAHSLTARSPIKPAYERKDFIN